MYKVAFLGLGVMGFPMAGHLAEAGYSINVYNRTEAKAQKWTEKHSGHLTETPAAAAQGRDFVMSCVAKDEDLLEVTLGADGAFQTLGKDAIFIDHSTTSAQTARKLAQEAKKRGFHFIDAPVSGGQSGAEQGTLAIMCGGEEEIFNRAKQVIACYAKTMSLVGKVGDGQLVKMVNQVCVLGIIQSLAEGMYLAEKVGLDLDKVITPISQGASSSWQMNNRWGTMAQGKFDFGFSLDLMRKDIAIAKQEAKKLGISLPVTELVDDLYAQLQEQGDGGLDSSSLIKLLRDEH